MKLFICVNLSKNISLGIC